MFTLMSSVKEIRYSFIQSGKIENATLKMSNGKVFLASIIVFVLSITAIKTLEEMFLFPYSVANGYRGDNANEDLKVFDIRFGYSVDVVTELLTRWGSSARYTYCLIGLVDLFPYMMAYRTCLVYLANMVLIFFTQQFPFFDKLKVLAFTPIIIVYVDTLETACQILFTLLFEWDWNYYRNDNYWQLLVNISSIFNQTKWIILAIYLPLLLILWVVAHVSNCFQVTSKSKQI